MGLFRKAKPVAPSDETKATYPRPLDPLTNEPMELLSQPGYYAGFSTIGQKKYWEKATRDVVLNRVAERPLRRFFSQEDWDFWTLVFEHLLPQSDRTPERQIPLIVPLDERLFKDETDGYRYEDMPTDRVAYGLGVEAINDEAQERFDADFAQLSYPQREEVLEAIQGGKPEGGAKIWRKMSVQRFWELILSDAVKGYYRHPWSWDEIGFGGPAYPRAYTRLERGEPEPWEKEEQRYEWLAPEGSRSDRVENDTAHQTESQQKAGNGGKRS